jgi:sugar lactone lactonase YvrE
MKTSKLLPDPVKILALLLGSCLSILAAGRAHAQTADLFASVNHPNPTGPGAIFQYTPAGVQGTFVASVVQPRGLAFDCAGNLFVASNDFDVNGNSVGSILEVTPGGVVSTFTTGFPNNYFLEDIKFDSMGNLFVTANNESDPLVASTIFKVSPGGGVSIFGTLPGQGFGLAFDSMGNLFAADASDATIFKFTSAGTRSVFAGPSAFLPNQGPIGLAFNSAGNLFVSTSDNTNGQILEFAPNGAETTFATGLTNNPRGLAFDSAGNLFVAEVGVLLTGDILKFTPGGVETFFATPVGRPQGNGGPEFLAFPSPPCSGSVGTPGYWMNHPEAWCVQTITLCQTTYTKAQAIAIMKQSTSGDMTYQLAAHLFAAKLNVNCADANSSCVASAISAADNWFCTHPLGSKVTAKSAAWKQITSAFNTLVNYNEGKLCAPARQ